MASRTSTLDTVSAKTGSAVSAADRIMNAVMVASGIGSTVLGVLVVAADANPAIKTALTWDKGVGPLSGKVGYAMIAFFVSWAGLHFLFQRRSPTLITATLITGVLLAIGVALTFPPIFIPLAHLFVAE